MDHRTEAEAVAAADDVTMHTATKTVEEHAEAIMHDTKAIEATQKDELVGLPLPRLCHSDVSVEQGDGLCA